MIEYATAPKEHRTPVPRDDKPSRGSGEAIPVDWSREEIEKHLAGLNFKATPIKRPVIPRNGKRGGV